MHPFRDTALIFGRNLTNTLHNPVWVIIGLFQPLLYLFLFMPLLGRLEPNPLAVFLPGLLMMCAMLTFATAGFGLLGDAREGVIERFRVTPVSRLAFMAGTLLNDLLVLLLQCLVLVALSLLLGYRPSPAGLAGALLLALLSGAGMTSLSYGLGLIIRDENGLASVTNTFFLPILLLSGVLLPLTEAPGYLNFLAALNPFSYIVQAARLLCERGSYDGTVALGFILAALLAGFSLVWAARCFDRTG